MRVPHGFKINSKRHPCMKTLALSLAAIAALICANPLSAQVPNLLNYQGRVAVDTVNFDGPGQFKFALVDATGATTYWSNDGTSAAGSQPTAAVAITVTKGLYAVLLGDTALANMTAISTAVFANADVRLRVWFNDGINGFQLLTPDQRLAAVGYAMMADTVPDGAIASAQLAPNLTLAGTTTGTFAGSGTTAFQTVAGTTQNAVANSNYLLTNAALSTVTLPAAPAVGEVVRVNGVGAGGWQVAPNAGQSIVGAGTTLGPAGVTWTPQENVRSWGSVASSSDGMKLIAAVSNGQLYTSTDAGVTWIARENNRNWWDVASSADGTKLLAAVGSGQLYTSTDSGATWTPRQSNRTWKAVASSADGTKLVAAVGSGQIYTSADSGVTWTPRESSRAWNSLASSSDGSVLLAAAINEGVYVSLDSGVTWNASLSVSVNAVAASGNGTKLVATAVNGQIYTSADTGATWTPRESIRSWISVASSSDGGKLLAGTLNGQLYTSTDAGVTWTARESNRFWLDVASSGDGSRLVAVDAGPGRIYTSTAASLPSPLTGAAGTTVALQYIGGNQWQALVEARAASADTVTAAGITGTLTSAQLASGLTLNGSLTGNATTATNATSLIAQLASAGTLNQPGNPVDWTQLKSVPAALVGFTGNLAGDVQGTLSATVVNSVGGASAASVAAAVNLANAATSANTANTIVKRDGSAGFSAGNISTGVFSLPATTNYITGVIQQNGSRVLHSYGVSNFFAGNTAGNFSMAGDHNTGFGNFTLASTTSGVDNTASGDSALFNNLGGSSNTANGSRALFLNTAGGGLTAVGAQALYNNTTANNNTGVGASALFSTSTGFNNTAVGASALSSNTGTGNIGLGFQAGISLTTGNDNICIGSSGVAGEAGTIRIGNFNRTRAFIAGIRGVTTGSNNGVAVLIDSNGQLGTVSSSRRYKEEIAEMGEASARLRALRPVTFRYTQPYADGRKPLQFGLIAEEVAEVFPELAVFNDAGQPETVKYHDLTPLLLNEVQKLTAEKDELKKQLAERDARDRERDARLSRLESLLPAATKASAH